MLCFAEAAAPKPDEEKEEKREDEAVGQGAVAPEQQQQPEAELGWTAVNLCDVSFLSSPSSTVAEAGDAETGELASMLGNMLAGLPSSVSLGTPS